MTKQRLSGPPPHIGWWQASANDNPDIWRWWDGQQWSAAVLAGATPEWVAEQAAKPALLSDIRWTTWWPGHARVPRLDCSQGHWTFSDGRRPVAKDTVVEVQLRAAATPSSPRAAGEFYWPILGTASDIVAWRPA